MEIRLFLIRLQQVIFELIRTAVKTSSDLFRITIPISIGVRLLNEFGATEYLGEFLSPVMEFVGLPGSMGLVWAAAMLTNLYAGLIVFASLAPDVHLTVAQFTVLTTIMLVAHALPVELRIAQKAGPRFRIMFLLRISCALLIGFILNAVYTYGDFLQTEYIPVWNQTVQNPDWIQWAISESRNMAYIFLIILGLLSLMKVLNYLKITDLLTTVLKPVLSLMGMSKDAAPITIIGMTMGLGYGGGLIIQEAQSGRMLKRDVFFSLSFMGLFHSIFEDTLLMIVMGGHTSGVLWGRFFFALIVVFLMVKLFNNMSEKTFDRFFFRSPPSNQSQGT